MATIVSLHAHPDDEALLTGGWQAQRAHAGDRVIVVFATDGAAGLAGSEFGTHDDLARVRRGEAEQSTAALGVSRLEWLGYADSGMAKQPTTSANRFVDAPVDEVARRVAGLVAAESAEIITGYDAQGGYGHPDHVHVHHVARAAQRIAGVRLLEATIDRTSMVRVLRVLRMLGRWLPGMTLPSDDIFTERTDIDHCIDVSDQLAAKRAALAAHGSQATGGARTIALLLALPYPLARKVLGTEWFVEVRAPSAEDS